MNGLTQIYNRWNSINYHPNNPPRNTQLLEIYSPTTADTSS